jgi:branched-chain amino acid transport system ATP-binding protein
MTALEIADLHVWHDSAHLLHGISFQVEPGEIVSLVGAPNSGHVTTLQAILGLTDIRQGSIRIRGTESITMPAQHIAPLGIGHYHRAHTLVDTLSCEDNILSIAGTTTLGGGLSLAEIYAFFPALERQRGDAVSGLLPEARHLLMLARLLRSGANVLLLENLFGSVGPEAHCGVRTALMQICSEGYAIVMAEQDLNVSKRIATHNYIMEDGHIVNHLESV